MTVRSAVCPRKNGSRSVRWARAPDLCRQVNVATHRRGADLPPHRAIRSTPPAAALTLQILVGGCNTATATATIMSGAAAERLLQVRIRAASAAAALFASQCPGRKMATVPAVGQTSRSNLLRTNLTLQQRNSKPEWTLRWQHRQHGTWLNCATRLATCLRRLGLTWGSRPCRRTVQLPRVLPLCSTTPSKHVLRPRPRSMTAAPVASARTFMMSPEAPLHTTHQTIPLGLMMTAMVLLMALIRPTTSPRIRRRAPFTLLLMQATQT